MHDKNKSRKILTKDMVSCDGKKRIDSLLDGPRETLVASGQTHFKITILIHEKKTSVTSVTW